MIEYMNQLEFEWDDEKEKKNIRIHKIDFTTAAHVFADECRVEKYDGKYVLDKDIEAYEQGTDTVEVLCFNNHTIKIFLICFIFLTRDPPKGI